EPTNVELSGSSEAIEGTDVNMCCSTSSSNPPVHIRWWLGIKELNTTDIEVTEVDDTGLFRESESPTHLFLFH
ncbi:nephrin isoform X1, partial [Tachysurus ichikawai]